MKIACIGNMNNAMYPLTRYLVDEGHIVSLFLLDEFEHFMPEADTYNIDDRVKIIHLNWSDMTFYKTKKRVIIDLFKPFDFFIGTDFSPAYLLKIKRRLDVFFPAGGDLFDYPFRPLQKKGFFSEEFQIEAWRCARYQKLGLQLVSVVSMDSASDDLEIYLKRLKMDKLHRIQALPFLYLPQYKDAFFQQSVYINQIKKLRNENDFLIIQHCRQSWTCIKSDLHYKGNEILIEGFSNYVKSHPNIKARLLLLEYGLDINASRELIKSLGIEDFVTWLPKMYRRDLMAVIRFCDAGVGELGRSWFSYGAVYEILAMKIPFIGNRIDKEYLKKRYDLYPMYHAETKIHVEKQLSYIYNNKSKSKIVAENAYQWFLDNAITKSIDQLRFILKEKAFSRKIGIYDRVKILFIDIETSFILIATRIGRKIGHVLKFKNIVKTRKIINQ